MPAVDPDNDLAALQTALAAERVARQEAEARASSAEAMVAHLKLLIAKMKRDRFGQSSKRGRRLLDQLELQLEELGANATEAAAGKAEPDPTTVRGFTRKKPVRRPLPAHLPRERVVDPGAEFLPLLRRQAARDGRGHHRDAGSAAAAMESDPDGAREVDVPDLREDHPAAGAIPRHRPGAGWGKPVGDDPLRQVRRAPAVEPAERLLRKGRHPANALYHWARLATQHDTLSRRRYAALRQRGHSHGRALRTVADRLLSVACTLLERQTVFDPTYKVHEAAGA